MKRKQIYELFSIDGPDPEEIVRTDQGILDCVQECIGVLNERNRLSTKKLLNSIYPNMAAAYGKKKKSIFDIFKGGWKSK